MLGSSGKRKLICGGALLMPLAVVKVAAVWLGSGPSAVNASAVDPVPVTALPAGPNTSSYTEEQLAVARYNAQLTTEPFGPSPMFYQPGNTDEPASVEVPTRGEIEIRVTLIMESSTGSIALINSKPYREGETIGGSIWTVKSIDAARRIVELVHPESGKTRTASVPKP